MSTCSVVGVAWDIRGDVGELPFILDRDTLDTNPGSELTPTGTGAGAADAFSFGEMLLSARWSWGATSPLGPLTMAAGGELRLSLVDTERLLDPLNEDSRWRHTVVAGIPLTLWAGSGLAFTGILTAWTHDLGSATSTMTIVDCIAEAAQQPMPDAPIATSIGYAPRDEAEAYFLAAGWAGRYQLEGNAENLRATAYNPVTRSGSLLAAVQDAAFSALAELAADRNGQFRWIEQNRVPTIPTSSALINCGGVLLNGLESGIGLGRVRNSVKITGTPGSGEWFGAQQTFDYVDPTERAFEHRQIVSSTTELNIGQGMFPSGPGAASATIYLQNAGLHGLAADRYTIELYDPVGTVVWSDDQPVPPAFGSPLPFGQTCQIAYGGPALLVNTVYRYRARFRLLGGTFGPWYGSTFTWGTQGLVDRTYRLWAETIFRRLGGPRPLTVLGTMAPKGTAEVTSIVQAQYGAIWTVEDTHVSPPLLVNLRLLGLSCSLTPGRLEVDAVTEDA